MRTAILAAVGSLCAACSSIGGGGYGFSDYALVRVHRVNVGDGSLSVAPPRRVEPPPRHSFSRTFAMSRIGP